MSEAVSETPSTESEIDRSMTEQDAASFYRIASTRRAVRHFTDEPVPEVAMRRCLEAALLAPNASNLQPWEFYWVRDPAKRTKLNELCSHFPAIESAAEVVVCVARPDRWRRQRKKMIALMQECNTQFPEPFVKYYDLIVPVNYTVGFFGLVGRLKALLFFLIGLFMPIPRPKKSHADMKCWATTSVALASENLMLAVRAEGFDSCPTNADDSVRLKKLLRLPSRAFIVMVLGIGKQAPEDWDLGPRLRFPSEEAIKVV